MIVDLSVMGIVGAINVQNYQTVYIQVKPVDGDADTAVVEVKRAFDAGLRTPSSSFSTTKTLALDGSSILAIDVTDTAFVHFDVTTAQASRSVDIEFLLADPMEGSTFTVLVDAGIIGIQSEFSVHRSAHVSIIASPQSVVTTAAIELKHSLGVSLPPVSFTPSASLSLDGSTILDQDLSPGAWMLPDVTTIQAGQVVDLYVYTRKTVTSDETSQPQPSEILLFAEEGGNLSSGTSSGFQFSFGNGDVADGFGCVVPFDAQIVGVGLSVRSNSSGNGTVEVYKGADSDSTSSPTGVSVSLSSGERHNYTDSTGSPVSVNAGDWITFKTTAVSGTINGARVCAWIRPT